MSQYQTPSAVLRALLAFFPTFDAMRNAIVKRRIDFAERGLYPGVVAIAYDLLAEQEALK